MSRKRSGPAATPKAAPSKRPKAHKGRKKGSVSGELDLNGKVFDKAEYRLPFRMAYLTNSPGRKRAIMPPAYLRAAVESGLAEMVPPSEGSRSGELLQPIGDHPPARMTTDDLKKLLAEGIARTLMELEKKRN